MYEYKFVTFVEKGIFAYKFNKKLDYKKVIEEHAKDGWHFIQMITPVGLAVSDYELIFERRIEKNKI